MEAKQAIDPPKENLYVYTKSLTIKIPSSGNNPGKGILINTFASNTDSLPQNLAAFSMKLSPNNSTALISPPSSAFVSALQSPYISPRATLVANQPAETPIVLATLSHPSPQPSYGGSQSDNVPSTSYTPPLERYDFSGNPAGKKHKVITRVPVLGQDTDPRILFSFPVPRISFAKATISPASNAKLRSFDVYIGYHGWNPNLVRFCKWVKSELELQGIACFIADRAKYADNQSHEIVDRVICSVTFGVVIITNYSLFNHMSLEEVRFFVQKKSLIPLFFDMDATEVASLANHHSENKKFKDSLDAVLKFHDYKLEANKDNWRSCMSKAAGILRDKLGRSVADKNTEVLEEFPFPRNKYFVGREKEILEIETKFFGCGDSFQEESPMPNVKGGTPGQSKGLADNQSKESNKETWVEPVVGSSLKGPKYRKSKSEKDKNFQNSVVCINGLPGVGKTELALEFAYRYCQRYKMVFWVCGEAQYFQQNVLKLSLNLGLDVSADGEKERGRIRTFDQQESEAFKRVKREMFQDVPYLLIIDNLETEEEWWDGKGLHDLIPRNTGSTHVIITTRLSQVMNFDTMKLQPLHAYDAMILIQGRQIKEYLVREVEVLQRIVEKLESSSFGLWVVGSLLTELAISPSTLFEAVNQMPLEDINSYSSLSIDDKKFCRTNPFLMKTLAFCATILQQMTARENFLATRMLQCLTCQKWKSEEEAALLLVRFGLARRANRKPGCWIQLHPITQIFAKRKDGLVAVKATLQGVQRSGNLQIDSDHLWACVFHVFGFKSEPPIAQLNAIDMVPFIRNTLLPLAINAFTTFSRCSIALELLKGCTDVLEEVERSFASQIQDWYHGSLCWKKKPQSNQRVDEYVWQEVTLLKATLLETRAELLLRGGHFDSSEELCRSCINIRTVMLGHNHAQTLAAQQTLAKLVRMRIRLVGVSTSQRIVISQLQVSNANQQIVQDSRDPKNQSRTDNQGCNHELIANVPAENNDRIFTEEV
nr:Disease resistance protein [Ipomoea batatas]